MELTKRLLTIAGLLLTVTTGALAQSSDYKKWEFFGGYSALYFDNLAGDTDNPAVNDVLGDRQTLRGFELAVTRNFLGSPFVIPGTRQDNLRLSVGVVIH